MRCFCTPDKACCPEHERVREDGFGTKDCACIGRSEYPGGPIAWEIAHGCPLHHEMWQPRDAIPMPAIIQMTAPPSVGTFLTYRIPGVHSSGSTLVLCFALTDNGVEPLVWSTRRHLLVTAQIFVDDEMRWNNKGAVLEYWIT